MEVLRDTKVLVIGSSGHQYVDCIEWAYDDYPNIVDYALIVLNVRSITEEFLRKIPLKTIQKIQFSIIRFLRSGGDLIVLTDFFKSVKRTELLDDYCNNYFWSPISFNLIEESGNTIEGDSDVLQSYYNEFKKWHYYFEFSKVFLSKELKRLRYIDPKIKFDIATDAILRNRYGKMLAGTFRIESYRKTSRIKFEEAFDGFNDPVGGAAVPQVDFRILILAAGQNGLNIIFNRLGGAQAIGACGDGDRALGIGP